MTRRTTSLLGILGVAVLLSVALTAYRTLVLHDFVVSSAPAEQVNVPGSLP